MATESPTRTKSEPLSHWQPFARSQGVHPRGWGTVIPPPRGHFQTIIGWDTHQGGSRNSGYFSPRGSLPLLNVVHVHEKVSLSQPTPSEEIQLPLSWGCVTSKGLRGSPPRGLHFRPQESLRQKGKQRGSQTSPRGYLSPLEVMCPRSTHLAQAGLASRKGTIIPSPRFPMHMQENEAPKSASSRSLPRHGFRPSRRSRGSSAHDRVPRPQRRCASELTKGVGRSPERYNFPYEIPFAQTKTGRSSQGLTRGAASAPLGSLRDKSRRMHSRGSSVQPESLSKTT